LSANRRSLVACERKTRLGSRGLRFKCLRELTRIRV
jgi:hypothetical protein